MLAQHFSNLDLTFLYVFLCNKLLCLTETYILYELDKHIGMTTVKLLSNENLIFILAINQIDAQNFCFTISLFHASTCFEHHVLITCRWPSRARGGHLQVMSTWCSKHVEA